MSDYSDHQLIEQAEALAAERARWAKVLAPCKTADRHAEANQAQAALMKNELQRRRASDGMTPTEHFLAWLANGHKPSAKELETLAYALHSTSVDLPEINWMLHSFEQVGDSLHKAITITTNSASME